MPRQMEPSPAARTRPAGQPKPQTAATKRSLRVNQHMLHSNRSKPSWSMRDRGRPISGKPAAGAYIFNASQACNIQPIGGYVVWQVRGWNAHSGEGCARCFRVNGEEVGAKMHPFRNTLRIDVVERQQVFKHGDIGVSCRFEASFRPRW